MKIKRLLLLSILGTTLSLSSLISPASATFIGAANGQNVTAYIADPGKLSYYSTIPTQYYSVAVPPGTCGGKGTVWPYGAITILDSPVYISGVGNRSSFMVEDQNPCSTRETKYQLDIFFGYGPKYGTLWYRARDFGTKTRNYVVDY